MWNALEYGKFLARIAAKDEFARMRFCFDNLSYLDVNKRIYWL